MSDLFLGAAKYYSKYRLPYPKDFFDRLIASFALGPEDRVIDLGTGTGQLAIPLAKHVKEIVAVDPDEGMLEQGKIDAENLAVTNIQWELGRAEDISQDLGNFKLATLGASFHWMDQDTVLSKVHGMILTGGGIAIGANESTIVGNPNKDPWKDATWTLIKKYLGEKRRAGSGFFEKPKKDFETALVGNSFRNLEKYEEKYVAVRTLPDIIGYLATTSFASPRLFGERYEEFTNELTEELLKLEPNGLFQDTVLLKFLFAWK